MVESGGDKLVNLLSRNDPWSSKRVCKDQGCTPCKTRLWIREQEKEVKQAKEKLPELLLRKHPVQKGRCQLHLTVSPMCPPGETEPLQGGRRHTLLESARVSTPRTLPRVW